ncbi:MAG: DUF5989 family protein [Myxococcota bacterium]
MKRLAYRVRLVREFIAFAHQRRAYWLIPLVGLLAAAALLAAGSQAITPLIYTIF